MSDTVVDISGLAHTYMSGTPMEQEALRDISFSVAEGESVALVGPTGSGKSTLLQHINAVYRPQLGTVRVLGHDVGSPRCDVTRLRRHVGLVLQDPGQQVFERFVGDDVAFGPRMAGLSGVELTRRVRWAMEQVGLAFETFRDRPTFALSGGERRKVGLAGVVALDPRILLLDEPSAGLDPNAHEELLKTLEAFRARGVTLITATHSMNDVAAIADRVIVLNAGRLVLDGSAREVFARAGELEDIGLELPDATEIAHRIADRGIALPRDLLTLVEVEEAVLAALGTGR